MRFTIFIAASFALAPSLALAQAPSRAARILALSGDVVGVVVARDRVFVADPSVRALSACADARCAPVRGIEACAVPRCPGTGALLTLESSISNVSDLPTDRDGFTRAVGALRSDPALASIAWSFGTHPDPPPEPAHWITTSRRERIVWELGAYGIGGVLGATGVALAGGEVSGGFRFAWDARNGDDELLALLLGNVLGLDVRVRAFDLMPVQAPSEGGMTIGLAPEFGYAARNETFRLPTLYSVIVPEVGVALRGGRAPTWYAGWSLPVAFLLDEHFGLEARASVMIVDEWIPGDDVEAIVSLSLGLIAR